MYSTEALVNQNAKELQMYIVTFANHNIYSQIISIQITVNDLEQQE